MEEQKVLNQKSPNNQEKDYKEEKNNNGMYIIRK